MLPFSINVSLFSASPPFPFPLFSWRFQLPVFLLIHGDFELHHKPDLVGSRACDLSRQLLSLLREYMQCYPPTYSPEFCFKHSTL